MSIMKDRQECCKRSCRWTGTYNDMMKRPNYDGFSSVYVCPECGGDSFYVLDKPVQSDRVDHANELIKLIASYGREFFRNGETIANMEIDKRGKIWFVDDYTRRRIYTHYSGEWRGFSHGGTMRNLVIALRDYITKDSILNPRIIAPKGFCEDGSNIWGYEPSEAEALRQAAWKLPMFPPTKEQLGVIL